MSIKRKPVFTENLTVYKKFLQIANNGFNTTVTSLQQSIKLNNAILAVIEKYSRNELVTIDDFKSIAACGCPDYSFLKTCSQSEPDEDGDFLIPVSKHSAFNCSEYTCHACWQHFINEAAKTLNNSELSGIELPEDLD